MYASSADVQQVEGCHPIATAWQPAGAPYTCAANCGNDVGDFLYQNVTEGHDTAPTCLPLEPSFLDVPWTRGPQKMHTDVIQPLPTFVHACKDTTQMYYGQACMVWQALAPVSSAIQSGQFCPLPGAQGMQMQPLSLGNGELDVKHTWPSSSSVQHHESLLHASSHHERLPSTCSALPAHAHAAPAVVDHSTKNPYLAVRHGDGMKAPHRTHRRQLVHDNAALRDALSAALLEVRLLRDILRQFACLQPPRCRRVSRPAPSCFP